MSVQLLNFSVDVNCLFDTRNNVEWILNGEHMVGASIIIIIYAISACLGKMANKI